MLRVVLYQPEIPPNTGNIIRLCANTGLSLHLIEPLGFSMNDKALQRAGLDYHEYANIKLHKNWNDFQEFACDKGRVFAFSTRGDTAYHQVSYQKDDFLLFGPETRGLPGDLLASLAKGQVVRIPMQAESRSLNLSNTVAVVSYEALRQLNFPGLA